MAKSQWPKQNFVLTHLTHANAGAGQAAIQQLGVFDLGAPPSFRASKIFTFKKQMGRRGNTRHTSFITMSVYK